MTENEHPETTPTEHAPERARKPKTMYTEQLLSDDHDSMGDGAFFESLEY